MNNIKKCDYENCIENIMGLKAYKGVEIIDQITPIIKEKTTS